MASEPPWEFHPDLTEDRLRTVAKLLVEVRLDALQDFNPAKGDRAWGHGCRVYERSCARLQQAASAVPWLEILDSSLHFVFRIGSVPVRFYRGTPEHPRSTSLGRHIPELLAQQEAFAFVNQEDDGWFWRIAVETEASGEVSQVVVFQTRESGEETRRVWSIPTDAPVSVLASLGEIAAAVPLEPATVDVPTVPDAARRDAGTD